MIQKMRSFFLQSLRVWKILRKPTKFEYKPTIKVAALGIILLGLVGFLISLVMKFTFG